MGGCVSIAAAPTVLTLMAMGSEDVGRLRLGRDVLASEGIVGLARDLKVMGGRAWGIRDDEGGGGGGGEEGDTVGDLVVSVVGKGVGNVGRKMG